MELDEHLNFDVREGIGWLTLDRPAAKNAMTKSMYAGIRDVCRRVRTDDEIQVLVIQGVSGAFTVGGDLKEVLEMLREGDAAGVVAYGDYLPFEALRSLPKPTIALINGLCMGGGLTLALMCDIRIATSQSRFAIPEAKVGIVDAHLPRLLRERVPAARLRYWLYTGATFSATEAYHAGILTMVVDSEEVDNVLSRTIQELQSSSPQAIELLKSILTETWTLPGMNDANTTLLGDDARGRIAEFAERSARRR